VGVRRRDRRRHRDCRGCESRKEFHGAEATEGVRETQDRQSVSYEKKNRKNKLTRRVWAPPLCPDPSSRASGIWPSSPASRCPLRCDVQKSTGSRSSSRASWSSRVMSLRRKNRGNCLRLQKKHEVLRTLYPYRSRTPLRHPAAGPPEEPSESSESSAPKSCGLQRDWTIGTRELQN